MASFILSLVNALAVSFRLAFFVFNDFNLYRACCTQDSWANLIFVGNNELACVIISTYSATRLKAEVPEVPPTSYAWLCVLTKR